MTNDLHTFCVAPMMDWTDRHCRYFLRLISRHALLYTEMVTTGALLHGNRSRFLRFDPFEQPLALQLGGNKPTDLAQCSRLAERSGFQEINLNVGCPSDRVQNGRIGACLMAEPALVADCIKAMRDAVSIPVTVKCRIGIDDMDSYEELHAFIEQVAAAGCETFIVHARIAILNGLSPKENREIPPLNYDRVFKIKENFPNLEIIINGGITSIAQAKELLTRVDGVMVGREAYQNPYFLAAVDREFYACENSPLSRAQVLENFYLYAERELANGVILKHMTRHILGLYQGLPGARKFRRYLSEHAHCHDAGLDTLHEAVALVESLPGAVITGENHVSKYQQVF
ncbi:MAG: tRNA dihydrouridine(20/20a) synthase DusA [Pseudomonadales bacterium]|nr:tRNA dihydrouridine(20/20a) synthase DusA [Pseudomonadales bacterium]